MSIHEVLNLYEQKDQILYGYREGLKYGKKAQYCFQNIRYAETIDEYMWYDMWMDMSFKEDMNFDGFVVGFNEGFYDKTTENQLDYNQGFYRGNEEGYNLFYSTVGMKNNVYSEGYQDGWNVGKHFAGLTGRVFDRFDSCKHD